MNADYRWYWAVGLAALVAALYFLSPILSPFLIGMLLAYLGDPLADRLERLGLSRVMAVLVVFALGTGILILCIGILVPLLGNQISWLRDQIPAMIDWVNHTALPWIESRTGVSTDDFRLDTVRETIRDNLSSTGGVLGMILAQATRSTMALITWLVNLFMIPVVGFYLLRDFDYIIERCRNLLPREREPVIVALVKECDMVLGAFIRGQLLVMLCLGILYSLGLWLVGLDLAVLIGMVAGLASIVPYLGFAVGIAAALIAAAFQFGDIFHLVMVVVAFSVVQTLESVVLTPWLVGDRIGLHPVAVIFAVLAGGQLFGFVGILVALPVAAIIMVLVRHANRHYKASEAYMQSADTEDIITDIDQAKPD
ncbi:Predicted PurR-regulated permease PerM [Halopseudomonas xinjiangensis]|uniref:Predicted PurR-regulated permease PerM n=1 Tax=Halopseudomonas xinjiangensis TaxID=487184 RepID=A0A1H1UKT1_9GAMM|nr:AI-2E family transporter [Halopseudomonas xinjiangensis]SDS73073.1 Predicted PurR-regulated permease PerM [Halopseudomonas xinjiangensis]